MQPLLMTKSVKKLLRYTTFFCNKHNEDELYVYDDLELENRGHTGGLRS